VNRYCLRCRINSPYSTCPKCGSSLVFRLHFARNILAYIQLQADKMIACGICNTTDKKCWYTMEGVPYTDDKDTSLCGQCYASTLEQGQKALV
jgi:hypothetical protein